MLPSRSNAAQAPWLRGFTRQFRTPDTYCFYPMNRKRDETDNWYTLPFAERQHLMHEHGLVGRRYAGQVQQIVTGSIGFDDWEWGVTLFAEDPIAFKKLIYEMRFDEVSAVYALFGDFFFGLRLPIDKLFGWAGRQAHGGVPQVSTLRPGRPQRATRSASLPRARFDHVSSQAFR